MINYNGPYSAGAGHVRGGAPAGDLAGSPAPRRPGAIVVRRRRAARALIRRVDGCERGRAGGRRPATRREAASRPPFADAPACDAPAPTRAHPHAPSHRPQCHRPPPEVRACVSTPSFSPFCSSASISCACGRRVRRVAARRGQTSARAHNILIRERARCYGDSPHGRHRAALFAERASGRGRREKKKSGEAQRRRHTPGGAATGATVADESSSSSSSSSSVPPVKMINMAAVREQKLRCAELQRQAQAEGWLEGEPHCGVTFDGILCWNVSRAGDVQTQQCPDYVYGFRTEEVAQKTCVADGSWFRNALGVSWTNFSLCEAPLAPGPALTPEHQQHIELVERWTPVVRRMAQVGYTLSFVTLIVALCVLSSIKRLRCPRNSLHKHLFASFLLRAAITLLKDSLFVQGLGLPGDVLLGADGDMLFNKGANWECKAITSVWQYFIMANYTWILMEGLYLHNLIFLALFSDTSAIRLYVVLGWGLPLLFVGPWVAARAYLENEFCWTTNNSHLFLLIRLPIVCTVLVSFGLFLNISRVLLTKLRYAPYLERRRVRYRRFARSTLVLVPLFGVHYALFLGMSCGADRLPRLEIAWLFCDQFFASFQGLFVSLLYCLLNAEVRAELGRKWAQLLSGRRCGRRAGGAGGGGGGGGGLAALVGGWRPARGASLTSVLTSETLVRIAEKGRAPGRVRTLSGSEDERERMRSAQA